MRLGRKRQSSLAAFLPPLAPVAAPGMYEGHIPSVCGDPACDRLACIGYKAGRRDGYREGYAAGYGAGYAAGQASR